VLGFPCNQFGAQEPGSETEILEFARSKYGVSFPLFAKIEVNGPSACELYQWLKAGHPDDDGNEDIAWNFTKFLVSRSGEVLARYAPQVTPEEIGAALGEYLSAENTG
jgi:glutathione peroxidase